MLSPSQMRSWHIVYLALSIQAREAATTVAKSLAVGVGRRLQVRADVFNVLNHKNDQAPELRINNVAFGPITSATPTGAPAAARTFQLGGRLTF